MAFDVVIGHARITTAPTRSHGWYSDDGSASADWTADHGAAVRAIAVDADGNVYTGGDRIGLLTTRKYDRDGNLLWSNDHGATVYAIAVDSDGNVYTGGAVASSLTTRKYSADGTLLWSTNFGYTVYALALASDALYVGGNRASTGQQNVKCYPLDGGAAYWGTGGFATDVYGLALSADESALYIVANRSTTSSLRTLWKYNLNATVSVAPSLAWYSAAHGGDLRCVAVDADGNAYVGGALSSSVTTRRILANGSPDWTANHGSTVYSIAVHESSVVTGGNVSSGIHIRGYDTAGAARYSYALSTGYALALYVYEDIPTSTPGLPVSVVLGAPFVGPSVSPDGLQVLLGLGVPGFLSYPPPDIAEIAGPFRQVFRLYLIEPGDIVEVPLASIQCRRRAGASTWLTAEIPVYNPSLGAQCQDHIGREIVIYAGVDDGSGEQLGEFLRAELTDVDREWTAGSGRITLTGRVDNPAFTQQSRALLGVVSRGAEDGRHHATCSVDPLLRPNDEVFDGADTWVAGIIVYRISATESRMTVTEAL